MLPTFVIGLREGLEAALIVGIIAAFLRQSNRRDALRAVWLGVGAAVLVCLAVGVGLELLSANLPQRQQEMLECVVAAIAVLMISYMVLWMRRHSKDLRRDLQDAAGSALARGSAAALVVMAFLAVIREGFETSVFLLAAFQSAVSPVQAAVGVLLGIGLAVALGYLIYRGGVRLNLSRFFRITGVVLVLVAAGLVMSTLRAAYEAGWLTAGQQTALDLSAVARPGSVTESILTGMLGIRSTLPVVEVVAYVLYAVPMLLVVLWPVRRVPGRRPLGWALTGTAVAALAVAGVLVAAAPSAPGAVTTAQGPFALTGDPAATGGTTATGSATVTIAAGGTAAQLAAEIGVGGVGSTIEGDSTLTATGGATVSAADGTGHSATRYTGTPITRTVDAAAAGQAGLPATLTAQQIAAANGGRLPVGLRAGGTAATSGWPTTWTETLVPQLSLDAATGTVLDVQLQLTRTAAVTLDNGTVVAVGTAGSAAGSDGAATGEITVAATADTVAAALPRVADADARRDSAELYGRVLPALLLVFALTLLLFGLPKVLRPGRAARPRGLPTTAGPADSDTRVPATTPAPAEHPPA
ncbi:iron uptake transporter permease EfeU [Nakamurella flava]|uniref:iron uptake transporter permease EfeU n=1 Tax=Nakamurella flava TaxID=2576308 RepID=UPI00197C54DB|nr:iron uptake transporter permease EfeU [Nakamurella flava]